MLTIPRFTRALKPGGWIELQELRFQVSCDDDTMKEGYLVKDFIDNVGKGLAAFGVNLLAMEKNPENVAGAGFVNVDEKVFKVRSHPDDAVRPEHHGYSFYADIFAT